MKGLVGGVCGLVNVTGAAVFRVQYATQTHVYPRGDERRTGAPGDATLPASLPTSFASLPVVFWQPPS